MMMLVLNCGSSSVKYEVFEVEDQSEAALASGIVEEIGLGAPRLTYRLSGGDEIVQDTLSIKDHKEAIKVVLEALVAPRGGVLRGLQELRAVGHRVVHGGEQFAESVLITEQVLQAIRDNIPLAPLHNPANIQGIEAMQSLLPGIPQVAVFDTAFHQGMEPSAYLYAIPYRFYEKYNIRRYGFHGTSHRYVAGRAAEYLGRSLTDLKLVTCHLGNGASIAAIRHGRSVMTSMGFTPLEGLPMGTRCGNLDPAIVPFLMEQEELDTVAVSHLLNRESGVLGLSGLSSDMRVFEKAIHTGPEHPDYDRSMLVLKHYTLRVKQYIGSYAATMGGLDCVVFTGGVGENFAEICEWSCSGLEFLGIEGVKARRAKGQIVEASLPSSRSKVLIVPTDEELAIARDTYEIVSD